MTELSLYSYLQPIYRNLAKKYTSWMCAFIRVSNNSHFCVLECTHWVLKMDEPPQYFPYASTPKDTATMWRHQWPCREGVHLLILPPGTGNPSYATDYLLWTSSLVRTKYIHSYKRAYFKTEKGTCMYWSYYLGNFFLQKEWLTRNHDETVIEEKLNTFKSRLQKVLRLYISTGYSTAP